MDERDFAVPIYHVVGWQSPDPVVACNFVIAVQKSGHHLVRFQVSLRIEALVGPDAHREKLDWLLSILLHQLVE